MKRNIAPLKKLNMNLGWMPPSHNFHAPSSAWTVFKQLMKPEYFSLFSGIIGYYVASLVNTTSIGFVRRVAMKLEMIIAVSLVVTLVLIS